MTCDRSPIPGPALIRRAPAERIAFIDGYTAGATHVLSALDAGSAPEVVRGYVEATAELMWTSHNAREASRAA